MEARRLIPIGVVVTALLVLAGIASHGRPLSSGVGPGPSTSFFDYVATTLLLIAIALAVVFVLALAQERPASGQPRRGRWHIVSTVVSLAGAVAIAFLLMHSNFGARFRALVQQHSGQGQQARGQHLRPAGKNVRNARIRWDEVALVAVLVGGLGVYLFVTRTRRGTLRPLATRRRQAISRALDDSLDDLRNDPDVRRAIIAAYARMERALALVGVPRAPAEAPYEYLERSLVELDASADAARRLTDLFERAKFSHHDPPETMRDEAISALVAVRDDLRRPHAEPAAA